MQKFHNRIICGDCIEVLGEAGEPFADLIFADPPFNIGYKYDKYDDKVKSKNYVAWTKDWMSACKKVLKPDGSFYIAIGDDYAANVNVRGRLYEMPLHMAARKGHTNIMKLLISNDAEINANDGQARTPLFEAANAVAAELLIASGAQVGVRSKNAETALHYAVRYKHYEIVELLVVKGADVNAKDKMERTPLSWAQYNRDNKMIELLSKLGAKEYTPR